MSDKIDAVIASMGWDLDPQEWADMRRLCEAALAQQPAPVVQKPVGYFVKRSEFGPWIEVQQETEQNAILLYAAPAAPIAQEPDTVAVPRELLGRFLRTIERTANDTLDGRNVATELRALLAGGVK